MSYIGTNIATAIPVTSSNLADGAVIASKILDGAVNSAKIQDGFVTETDLQAALASKINGKQDTLVSGTSIKTVNGNSLLGSGAVTVGDVTLTGSQTLTNKTLTSPVVQQNVTVIGTNTTAVASRTYVLTASLTLTLPATPTAGDWVQISDRSGTTTQIIARNGQNIMGLAENFTVDISNFVATFVYADATRCWVIV